MRAVFAILLLCVFGLQAAAEDQPCDPAQSQRGVQKLIDSRTILSMDRFPPDVTVVIDERRWSQADLDTKKGIAVAVDCATAEPGSPMLRRIIFRSNRDSRVLGEYSRSILQLR